MATEIKPIETFYNGYRFRSRLEARWAVFFDAARIRYEYEPEGYEVDGIKYLPDFYLPDLDVHVEVKADRPGIINDIIKCSKVIYWGGAIKTIIFLRNVPHLDTFYGGHWHFPALYYKTGSKNSVVSGWWYFEDECDFMGNSMYVTGTITNANYPHPFYIHEDGTVSGRIIPQNGYKQSKPSLSPVTDHELKNENCLDKEYINFCIDFVETRNMLFYNALDKARQARFEHGECG